MVTELKFNTVDENTIGFSFKEEVERTGNMSREEFNNKYDTLLEKRSELEKRMQKDNVTRMQMDIELSAYEELKDSEIQNEDLSEE